MVANKRLKTLRDRHGYTLEYIANELGITASTYCRKENGLNNFIQRDIDILLRIFQKPYEEVFGTPS